MGVSLPFGGVLPEGVMAPFSCPLADAAAAVGVFDPPGVGVALPPAGPGMSCGGVAAALGVGFGTGLPAFFMLDWKFLTACSSAPTCNALAFSAAVLTFSAFSAATFGSSGGAGRNPTAFS